MYKPRFGAWAAFALAAIATPTLFVFRVALSVNDRPPPPWEVTQNPFVVLETSATPPHAACWNIKTATGVDRGCSPATPRCTTADFTDPAPAEPGTACRPCGSAVDVCVAVAAPALGRNQTDEHIGRAALEAIAAVDRAATHAQFGLLEWASGGYRLLAQLGSRISAAGNLVTGRASARPVGPPLPNHAMRGCRALLEKSRPPTKQLVILVRGGTGQPTAPAVPVTNDGRTRVLEIVVRSNQPRAPHVTLYAPDNRWKISGGLNDLVEKAVSLGPCT